MQTVSNLPGGHSAPNTVITEHAVRKYHLLTQLFGWLIQASAPLTATQIQAARRVTLAYEAPLEIASAGPELGEIADGGTALGIIIALGVLCRVRRPDPALAREFAGAPSGAVAEGCRASAVDGHD
jgi:hypothetical protein